MDGKPRWNIVLPAVALGVLLLLALLGSVVALGQQLASVHWMLGAAFYLLVAACVVAGVVFPVVCTLSRPVFGLYRLHEGSQSARKRRMRRMRANLESRAVLTVEDKNRLAESDGWTPCQMAAFFKEKASPAMERRIKESAKTAFVATAISQAPGYDMLTMMAVNVRLIRALVDECGYRPSGIALVGLYVRVMKTALLAGGLEELDLEEIVALIGGNAALQASGIVLASAAQGAANAFTTVRVGVIAKEMLLAEDGPADLAVLRRASYGQALAFVRSCGLLDDMKALVAKRAAAVRDGAVEKAMRVKDGIVEHAADAGSGLADWATSVRDDAVDRVGSLQETLSARTSAVRAKNAKKRLG